MKITNRRQSKNVEDLRESGRTDTIEGPEKPRGKITTGTLGKLRKSAEKFERKLAQPESLKNLLAPGRKRASIQHGFKPDPKDPYKLKTFATVKKAQRKKYGK